MTPPSPESSINSQTQPSEEGLADGRYVIVGTLGAGSQGETLEAVDKREGRPVAIKRFQIRGAKSWKDVELAEREARVLSSLDHPALPRYIEHFEEGGALYLVMEKIEGETLASRRRRGATLDQAQVLRFLKEAGACLAYLHGQAPPVVHRDIKPGNVILRPDGSYCLVDFGSVRDRLKPEGGSTVVGTFGFMAPEQFQGRAGAGSDVYAVAATALSLLTGSEPEDLPHKGLAIDVEAALRGHAERGMIQALRSMLEPDPERRSTSVERALAQAGLLKAPPREESRVHQGPSAQDAKAARKARAEAEGWFGDDAGASKKGRKRAERERRRDRKLERLIEERIQRKAERAARRAERHFAREWRPPGRPVPPGIALGNFILLALRIAGVATFALFGILLPLLFTLLGNARVRERMQQLNDAGQNGLGRAREHIRYRFLGGQMPAELEGFLRDRDISLDSPPTPAPRKRVAMDVEAELEEAEAEIEAELATQRKNR